MLALTWRRGVVVGALLSCALLLAACSGSSGTSSHHHKPNPGPVPTPPPRPVVPAGSQRVSCPTATTTVHNADELKATLSHPQPGQSIRIADGTYTGKFVGTGSGTAQQPIFLCGDSGAVLDGGGIKAGYALHLDGVSWWRLVGFTVRNGQKGVVADHTQHTVIQGLQVSGIGDEAIHLRTFSSENVVIGNSVSNTGLRRDKFGEGVYVGTAESNWCKLTNCKPDNSDRNVVRDNTIAGTRAESIDIKEGTTSGAIVDNTFDGTALAGADSWVDVKGNGWLIEGNTGHKSPQDGFQTHQVVNGWGTGNTFRRNVADVDGPGYGIHLAPIATNKVSCDNKASGAGQGLTNTKCA